MAQFLSGIIEKNLKKVIGTDFKFNQIVVGKIIEYNPNTGWVEVAINDDSFYKSLIEREKSNSLTQSFSVKSNVDHIKNKLLALTEEERVEVFSNFCTHCGCDDPGCQCCNEE